ncbi:MAG: hypothetical protein Q9195_007947 [Heterodermia aff. obscurata]
MDSETPQTSEVRDETAPFAPKPPFHREFSHIRKKKPGPSGSSSMSRVLSYVSGSRNAGEDVPGKNDKKLPSPSMKSTHSKTDASTVETVHSDPGEAGPGLGGGSSRSSHVFGTEERDTQEPHSAATKHHSRDVLEEPPLKRPSYQTSNSELCEKPLERPSNGCEKIPYSDTIAAFAVDVSGSTQGLVLKEEKRAIRTMLSGLSHAVVRQAEIIPWNDDVQNVFPCNRLETLYAHGGTEPSKLNLNPVSREALDRCSAWFLLTDGEIDQDEVESFSKGICDSGLHGTPSVIVLFGYKTAYPINCNISAGLSVFSNAADCLFLFHDVDTSQVYVLQSKGAFNGLLPPKAHELILTTATSWKSLPRFEYRQLFDLSLPARQQLRSDDLLLQGRTRINLQDLYENHVDRSIADQILTNNDNLISVLLASQLRGHDENIRRWFSDQAIRAKDVLLRERPDVGHRASEIMRQLLPILAHPGRDESVQSLRIALRNAHHTNWVEFVTTVSEEHEERFARNTVVSDAMDRIESNRIEMESKTNSPALLGPVSPNPGFLSNSYFPQCSPDKMLGEEASYRRFSFAQPLSGKQSPLPLQANAHFQSGSGNSRKARLKRLGIRSLRQQLMGDDMGALYIKHFKCLARDSDGFEGTCPICGEANTILCFLLKAPPNDISTQNFPLPHHRTVLAYPLAMGAYPETDILSSQISCDSCASTMVREDISCGGDRIEAAIPIIQTAFCKGFRSTTLSMMDTAFQERFQKDMNEAVFLAVLQNSLADPDDVNFNLMSEALKTTTSWIVRNIQLSPDMKISGSSSTSPRSANIFKRPMKQVLRQNLISILTKRAPLLQYPIGGFVVLMQIAMDLKLAQPTDVYHLAAWQRFLFLLVERHCTFLAADQQRAVAALHEILSSPVVHGDTEMVDVSNARNDLIVKAEAGQEVKEPDGSPNPSIENRPSSRPRLLDTIHETHLLPEEDLEEFQRLDNFSEAIEDHCAVFLERFLLSLSQDLRPLDPAIDVFERLRAREDLQDVFITRKGIPPVNDRYLRQNSPGEL